MMFSMALSLLIAASVYVRAPEVVQDVQAGVSGFIQVDEMLRRVNR